MYDLDEHYILWMIHSTVQKVHLRKWKVALVHIVLLTLGLWYVRWIVKTGIMIDVQRRAFNVRCRTRDVRRETST